MGQPVLGEGWGDSGGPEAGGFRPLGGRLGMACGMDFPIFLPRGVATVGMRRGVVVGRRAWGKRTRENLIRSPSYNHRVASRHLAAKIDGYAPLEGEKRGKKRPLFLSSRKPSVPVLGRGGFGGLSGLLEGSAGSLVGPQWGAVKQHEWSAKCRSGFTRVGQVGAQRIWALAYGAAGS